MKFGKQLARAGSTFPTKAYGDALINYKALKKRIKRITSAAAAYATKVNTPAATENGAVKAEPPVEPDYKHHATQFCNSVERELSKINQFYAQQVSIFQAQLTKTKQLHEGNVKFVQLAELCESMNALRRYIVLNYLGVMKIVKKHDKNSKVPVAQHLIPLLYAQPFYYSRVVASLYTEVELMYLDNPGMTDELRSSRLDDYKCPICLGKLESPVVLSCCHRFCFKCLSQLNDSTAQAKILHTCPCCRKPQPLDPSNYQVDDRLLAFMKRHAPMSPASSTSSHASSRLKHQSAVKGEQCNESNTLLSHSSNHSDHSNCLAGGHVHYEILDERKHADDIDEDEVTDDGDSSDAGSSDEDDDTEPNSSSIVAISGSPDPNDWSLAKGMQDVSTSSPITHHALLRSNQLNATNGSANTLSMSPFPFYNNNGMVMSTPLTAGASSHWYTDNTTDGSLTSLHLDPAAAPFDHSTHGYNTSTYAFNDDEQIAMVEQASELMATADETLQHAHTSSTSAPAHVSSAITSPSLKSTNKLSTGEDDSVWQTHLNYNIPEWALNAPLPLNLQRQTQKLQQYQHAFQQHDQYPPPYSALPEQQADASNMHHTLSDQTLQHLDQQHLQQLNRPATAHPTMYETPMFNQQQSSQQQVTNNALQNIILSVLSNSSNQNGLAAAATVLLSNPQLASLVQSQPGLADLLGAAVGQPMSPHTHTPGMQQSPTAEPVLQNGTLWVPIPINQHQAQQQQQQQQQPLYQQSSVPHSTPSSARPSPDSAALLQQLAHTLAQNQGVSRQVSAKSPHEQQQQSTHVSLSHIPLQPHIPHINTASNLSNKVPHMNTNGTYSENTTPAPSPAKRKKQRKNRQYKCTSESCDQVFKTRFSLKRHQKTHTGDKPFKCPIEYCHKQFAEKSTLTRHMRVHTGEKPFKCKYEQCDKSFADRTNVKRHELQHLNREVDLHGNEYVQSSEHQSSSGDSLSNNSTGTSVKFQPSPGLGDLSTVHEDVQTDSPLFDGMQPQSGMLRLLSNVSSSNV